MKKLLRTVAPALLVVLASCTTKSDPPSTSGTDQNGHAASETQKPAPKNDSAVGTWAIDSEATVAANMPMIEAQADAQGQDEEMRTQMKEMFAGMLAEMQLTVTLAEDGTMQGTAEQPSPFGGEPQQSTMTGTWTQEGDQVTMTGAEEGRAPETQIGTLDGDRMTIAMEAGPDTLQLIMVRH
ncbi:MAG: hypothetical protein R3F34_05565 [Planctomycetota bacterium]